MPPHAARGWRGESMVKSVCCSCSRPRFDSQYLHGDLQPSITPVPRNQHPLLVSVGSRQACGTYTYTGKTLILFFLKFGEKGNFLKSKEKNMLFLSFFSFHILWLDVIFKYYKKMYLFSTHLRTLGHKQVKMTSWEGHSR